MNIVGIMSSKYVMNHTSWASQLHDLQCQSNTNILKLYWFEYRYTMLSRSHFIFLHAISRADIDKISAVEYWSVHQAWAWVWPLTYKNIW